LIPGKGYPEKPKGFPVYFRKNFLNSLSEINLKNTESTCEYGRPVKKVEQQEKTLAHPPDSGSDFTDACPPSSPWPFFVKTLLVIFLTDILTHLLHERFPQVFDSGSLYQSPLLTIAISVLPLYVWLVKPEATRIREWHRFRESARRDLEQRSRQLDQALEELKLKTQAMEDYAAQLEGAQKVMQHANERFFNLFHGIPVACFTCDDEGRVYEFNQEAERLFGVSVTDVLLHSIFETFVPASQTEEIRNLLQQAMEGHKTVGHEWHYTPPRGEEKYLLCNVLPVRVREEEVTGVIFAALDITRLKRALTDLEVAHKEMESLNAQLAALAVTDAITGLPNHRSLQDYLKNRLQNSERPFALVMADVDFFKNFNDTFGHLAGDRVLALVGETLKNNVRRGDFVARYGGEEFCLIVETSIPERALSLVERLRQKISKIDTGGRTVTASFGVAMSEPNIGQQKLIHRADEALYKAKESGRNRVEFYTPQKRAA
jgi:diguanylate cyclase (GGDEF)-like protein/PAS domain S-box-containing protein